MTIIRIVIVINTFVSVRWIQIIFLWILILFSYFLEWNSPDILALSEINLDDSIDSGNFSVTVYLRLVRKDSITHMHLLTLYVKEELRFHGTYLWKTLQILTYAFNCLYLTQFLTSFSSINHLLYLLYLLYLFAWDLSLENSADSYLCYQLILYLTQFLTSFSSINHLLCLYAWFLILFHLTEMMFSWSTHLLMFLLLETLMSFIRTS